MGQPDRGGHGSSRTGHPHRRSADDLFDMAVRGLFTGDLCRHLVPPSPLPGPRPRQHQHLVLDRERLPGEHGRRRRGVDRPIDRRRPGRRRAPRLRRSGRSPSATIEWCSRRTALSVTARHAVVTIPPALTLDIAFDPALPDDRADALPPAPWPAPRPRRSSSTTSRSGGPTASAARAPSPGRRPRSPWTRHPASGRPGVHRRPSRFGAVAERTGALEAGERRKALSTRWRGASGPGRPRPGEFVETAWWTEPWTRGCSMAHFPPGVLTKHGPPAAPAPRPGCTGPGPRRLDHLARRHRRRGAVGSSGPRRRSSTATPDVVPPGPARPVASTGDSL